MLRLAVTVLLAGAITGCGAADDVVRVGGQSLDDVARLIAQRSGGTSDDAAHWLRTLGSAEDDAIRLGQRALATSPSVTTAESRVGTWIDSAASSLSPEAKAQVRGVALASTCDALDSFAQGRAPDLGTLVLSSIGSLSTAVDQQLLRNQLNDMFDELKPGGEATFVARSEILIACMVMNL